ncbi:MAG: hypothetical protein RBS39_05905 [Phycisphaerales bacterium]|nr:hypothetical protein [Phycisphaerales bacterium]
MQNWQQFIVPFLIIAFSVVPALMRKANEAQAAKKRQEALRRRQQDALRTGRAEPTAEVRFDPPGTTSGSPSNSPRERLEDIARRRREQMARRTGAQTQGPVPPTAPQQPAVEERVVYIPGVGRVVVRTPGAPQAPGNPSTPQRRTAPTGRVLPTARGPGPARTPPQAPARQGERRTDRAPRPTAPRMPSVRPTPTPIEEPVPHLPHDVPLTAAAPTAPSAPAASPLALRGMSRNDWRRAIILNEVLAPPVSQRPDHLAQRYVP